MKKMILFLILLFLPSALFAQSAAVKMALETTGEIPNWISSIAIVFFDAVSPLALKLNIMLSGVIRELLWIFLTVYLLGLGINAIRPGILMGKDAKDNTPFQFIPKRLFILIFTALFLTMPVKKLYENTIDPIISAMSVYTTEFMTNVDDNYASCLQHYSSASTNEDMEAISHETKANLVCPLNTAAKQIDIMMRIGVWFISGAVSEYLASFLMQFIPYVGKILHETVGWVLEQHAYVAFSLGIFLLTKGWALSLDMLWFLISVIMKLILATILIPFGMFSYAYKDEESGFFGKYTKNWLPKVLGLFKNGLLGFLFWCVVIGILGIFLQMVLNNLVFEIPIAGEMTEIKSANLADPNSVFYENGNIKDSVIVGLFFGLYNPANWPKWLGFIFGLQLAFYLFGILKGEMEKMAGGAVKDNFVEKLKTDVVPKVQARAKEYTKKFDYSQVKKWVQKKR